MKKCSALVVFFTRLSFAAQGLFTFGHFVTVAFLRIRYYSLLYSQKCEKV